MVVRVGAVEVEIPEVGGNEGVLGGLVEHEFEYLGAVVRGPAGEGGGEAGGAHEPGFLLVQEVGVCGCDGHEFDFGVEFCLEGRGEGDGEGGGVGVAFGGGGGGEGVVVVGEGGGGDDGFGGGDEGDVVGLEH